MDITNNLVYNEKFFELFKEFNAVEFINPLNKGFYYHLIVQQTLNGDINSFF